MYMINLILFEHP